VTARIDHAGAGAAAAAAAPSADGTRAGAGFAAALERALGDLDRGAGTPAATEAPLDARAALELQAAVYREAERVELASKLLDHGLAALKTVLQTRL
jgi:hypothetical protein